jgi:L-aspartate oxidase
MKSETVQIKDVLVLGSGVAGLSFALELSELRPELSILILSKGKLDAGSTALAQGGMAIPLDSDDFESHCNDTMRAGQGENDLEIVKQFLNSLPHAISKLESWGMSFDKKDGQYDRHLEGGHEVPRVLHCKDSTGKSLHQVLLNACLKQANIQIIEHQMAYRMRRLNTYWQVKVIDLNKEVSMSYAARQLVLASGGIGALFSNTTNDALSTGDALVMAMDSGLQLKDMGSVQFHPTALKIPHPIGRLPLLSEALRGKGATLVNSTGNRFMYRYDERGELSTRDIISKAIWKEMLVDDLNSVYLDARNIEGVSTHFPSVEKVLNEHGFQLDEDLIPVIPAAHYLCGGIPATLSGCTDFNTLYAIGECARTGIHGRNRLASNSLTEALVMALNAAEHLAKNYKKVIQVDEIDQHVLPLSYPDENDRKKTDTLRHLLSQQLYQMYSQDSYTQTTELVFGSLSLEFVNDLLKEGYLSRALIELRNLILIGRQIELDIVQHDEGHGISSYAQ